MKKYNLLLVFFLSSISGFSQSGYLGKKNSFELKTGIVPSYRLSNRIENSLAVRQGKLMNLNFIFSYSRVLARNFEAIAGYQFANVKCTSGAYIIQGEPTISGYQGASYYGNAYFLQEPTISYHGGYLGFNYYRLGCLAPIGKYVGLMFNYGLSSFQPDDEIIFGVRSDAVYSSAGFLKKSYTIYSSDTVGFTTPVTIKSWHLKARLGRNYPLTDFLVLNLGITIPIFSSYAHNLTERFGFQIDGPSSYSASGNWALYGMNSLKPYHKINFEVGLRFMI